MLTEGLAVPECNRIARWIAESCKAVLKRRGVVVGVSGGVDSAAALLLAVQALGPERVIALILPDKDSDPLSERLAREATTAAGVETLRMDISTILEASGCYALRDQAITSIVPDFEPLADKAKIVLPNNLLADAGLNIFSVVVVRPDGTEVRRRLTAERGRAIVAASNMKQRTRMLALYYHAEARHYAVLGTANKNEVDLGFFVKYGDGGVDIQPLAHLFKTEVYAVARTLNVPADIIRRVPTTDTYSAPGSQEEFFYRLSFEILDPVWCAHESGQPTDEIATAHHLTQTQVTHIIDDISSKQRSAAYLKREPLFLARKDILTA